MRAWIVPPIAGLIEPVPAPEIFIDDIGVVEACGPTIRIGYYCEEGPLFSGGQQNVVKLWLRRPLVRTPAILRKIAAINEFMIGMGHMPPAPPGRGPYSGPRLVS